MTVPEQGLLRPFTPEWADAFCAAVNASESYRAAAARWTWPVAFVVQRDPARGFAHDTAVVLTLEKGRCTGVKLVDGKHAIASFVFRATYERWRLVVRGELDPIIGVVKGEIGMSGSMAALMLHSRAAKALIEVARTVPTALDD
jgi:putative sterol carrier protein